LERTRVLLTSMPPLLAGLIEEMLIQEPDIEVVEESIDPAFRDVEFVITVLEKDELPDSCRSVLRARAFTKILGIERDGTRAFIYQLQPHKQPIGELSPETLVSAIRNDEGTFGDRSSRKQNPTGVIRAKGESDGKRH
jgi:hypothetical protein